MLNKAFWKGGTAVASILRKKITKLITISCRLAGCSFSCITRGKLWLAPWHAWGNLDFGSKWASPNACKHCREAALWNADNHRNAAWTHSHTCFLTVTWKFAPPLSFSAPLLQIFLTYTASYDTVSRCDSEEHAYTKQLWHPLKNPVLNYHIIHLSLPWRWVHISFSLSISPSCGGLSLCFLALSFSCFPNYPKEKTTMRADSFISNKLFFCKAAW